MYKKFYKKVIIRSYPLVPHFSHRGLFFDVYQKNIMVTKAIRLKKKKKPTSSQSQKVGFFCSIAKGFFSVDASRRLE
jgi:hypothetical protein